MEEAKGDMWMISEEGAHQIRQDLRNNDRQRDTAMFHACQVGDLLLSLFQFAQNTLHTPQQSSAKLIELDLSPFSIKERHPQLFFQARDHLAERRLRNRKLAGCLCHMFQPRHRLKILQL